MPLKRKAFLMLILTLIIVVGLFAANGSNDLSKGIATLVGGGVADHRKAALWGTLWTFAGSITAAILAGGLLNAFSGKGILTEVPAGSEFLLAVAMSAALWVAIATRTGMPVSTTHALTGALLGVGFVFKGMAGVNIGVLSEKFLIPLAISPIISFGAIFLLKPLFASRFIRAGLERCLCAFDREPCPTASGEAAACVAIPAVRTGVEAECVRADATTRLGVADSIHWISSGATCFARGLNDTPKILALGIVAAATLGVSTGFAFLLSAIAMAAGGMFAGRRVTEVLATKVTRLSAKEGMSANLVTSSVVIAASFFALPVSTTHVSSAAIMAVSAGKSESLIRNKSVREMLLAWLVTLPATAGLSALIFITLKPFHS